MTTKSSKTNIVNASSRRLSLLGVVGRWWSLLLTDEDDDGERVTPGREGDWENELDREGGHPDEAEDIENAEVLLVDDGEKTEKSHGEYEADEE